MKRLLLTCVLITTLLTIPSIAISGPCETLIQLQQNGLVMEFDIDNNEIYVNPSIWNKLILKGKKGLIIIASQCFDSHGSTKRVTIYDGYSGKKIASYGLWGGIKFH